jgi:hypothetical protein
MSRSTKRNIKFLVEVLIRYQTQLRKREANKKTKIYSYRDHRTEERGRGGGEEGCGGGW